MDEVVNEAPVTEETAVEETATAVLPGDKTPNHLLLQSLHEERTKRKEMEDKIALLENNASNDVFSDEGKVLERKIKEQDEKIATILQDNAWKDVLISYPVMKEKKEEFDAFRSDPENKGMNLRTATKAFLLEQGLFEPQRKGLEKTTGGPRIPVSQEQSVDDIKTLRETNPKKYNDMLMKGQIKFS